MPLESVVRDLIHIDLPAEGEWVKILPSLGRSHREEINTRVMARMRVLGLSAENDPLLLTEAALVGLSVIIRAWSFPEPITIESVRRLDEASQGAVFERMATTYQPPRTDDERKNSSAPGATPGSTAERSQTGSGG